MEEVGNRWGIGGVCVREKEKRKKERGGCEIGILQAWVHVNQMKSILLCANNVFQSNWSIELETNP